MEDQDGPCKVLTTTNLWGFATILGKSGGGLGGHWESTEISFLPCQSNTNYIELQKNEDLYVSYTLEYAMRFIAIQVLIQP